MLLNSYEFIFAFLPLSLVVYYALRPLGASAGALTMLVLSVVFYWFWAGANTVLLVISIVTNFALAHCIWRGQSRPRVALRWLLLGIVLNLGYLGYFKYSHFVVEQILGVKSAYLAQVLPLGISFFTFTQLMYLTDLYRGRAKLESPFVYGAFVTLYPHLPAGPLYHYSEIMPQLKAPAERAFWEDLSVGWTIFVFGLAKKILADRFAPIADAAFSAPADGLTVYAAWAGVLGYSLQIYFDFSGYTDMAIGIARMFGIVFPENFRSPYKATDIIDFWRRWHMTLSRFLRDYVYIPLGGNRYGEARRFTNILLTMLIGGLWHGANWTFILWGGLHGAFLVINHAWRLLPARVAIPTALSIALTFCCVTLAWVPFRARDLAQTATIFQAMLGIGARALPMADIQAYLANPSAIFASAWLRDVAWLGAGLAIVWVAPSTQEIMRAFQPVLRSDGDRAAVLRWTPQWPWAVTMALAFGFCLTQVSTAKVFLYWTF
jgi:alginate O-acetyltransferase complex protein AlgI